MSEAAGRRLQQIVYGVTGGLDPFQRIAGEEKPREKGPRSWEVGRADGEELLL